MTAKAARSPRQVALTAPPTARDVTGGYSEFLGYFMPRKVMCGKDLMQAAGTVTKKLAKWLAEKGYVEDTEDARSEQAKPQETCERSGGPRYSQRLLR